MKKSDFRVLIKHYFLRGKSIKETEEKLAKYYKESAPSHSMVHKWFTEFRCGRISTNDAERPGLPKEVTSQEIIDKIHIVLNDRRLKLREISETVNISAGRVWHILHECLGTRKLTARWVPRLLLADHKWGRVVASEQCLGMFQRNSKEFLRHYVTVDEIWIHYYTPETKNQSKIWTGPGESAPKKAKTVPSVDKVMATNFWDSHGIILFDAILKEKLPYLPRKKCFSTTTMHQLTRVPLQRPNYLIYATKYFLIHLISQI